MVDFDFPCETKQNKTKQEAKRKYARALTTKTCIWQPFDVDGVVAAPVRAKFHVMRGQCQAMQQFVTVLREHFATETLHVAWTALQAKLGAPGAGFADLIEAHDRYLHEILYSFVSPLFFISLFQSFCTHTCAHRCLLSTNARPVLTVLDGCLAQVVRYSVLLTSEPRFWERRALCDETTAAYTRFTDCAAFLCRVAAKMATKGFQEAKLEALLVRLNFNGFYATAAS